jgi:hypothetical protein
MWSRFNCPGRKDDEKGAEISAGVLHQREPRTIGYTPDRASSVEFPNLCSIGIARLDGDHRLAVTFAKMARLSVPFNLNGANGGQSIDRNSCGSVVVACFIKVRHESAIFIVELCFTLEHDHQATRMGESHLWNSSAAPAAST